MKLSVTILVVQVALFIGASHISRPQSELTDDDYAVYSEILQTHFVTEKVEHLVIGDHTLMEFPPVMMGMTQFGDSQEMKKIRESVSKEPSSDYESKNKNPVVRENKFSLKIKVVLLSAEERDKIFEIKSEGEHKTGNPKGFEMLKNLYPNSQGFMNLSRVGFNSAHTEALVYAGNICGGLCGSGEVFLLVKDGNFWKIKYAAMTWIS